MILNVSELQHTPKEVCLVTDVDRTMYRTTVGANLLLAATAHVLGSETQEIERTIDANRKVGQTTQIQDWIAQSGASPRQVQDVYQRFVDITNPEDVKYPDVDRYLEAVEESDIVTAVLLTMGPTLQQEAKISAMGLAGRVPFVIADPEHTENAAAKDWQIRSWLNPRSGVIEPKLSPLSLDITPAHPHGGLAQRAVLIDDKYEAFGLSGKRPQAGDSPGIGGFWVSRVDESVAPLRFEEQALVPHSIEPVPGLADVTKYIKNPDVLLAHDMVQLWSERVGDVAVTAHQNSK